MKLACADVRRQKPKVYKYISRFLQQNRCVSLISRYSNFGMLIYNIPDLSAYDFITLIQQNDNNR